MGTSTPSQPRLLVVHKDQRRLKALTQVLRTLDVLVEAQDKLADAAPLRRCDLVLVDYDSLESEERELLVGLYAQEDASLGRLVLSGGECRKDFVRLFGTRVLTNLLGGSVAYEPEDIIVTVQKLICRDIFGIEKYFPWGIRPRVFHVRRSGEKNELLEIARVYADEAGVHPRLGRQFRDVLDEFVTNAVYNAPVDATGRRRFANYSRDREVVLNPNEHVEVKFCSDGHRLGVSTTDCFGSLTESVPLIYLAKCFERSTDQVDDKEGGAGLGFYSVFESLSHFVININPGVRTEMIGIIDIRGSYKAFATSSKSFNVFVSA